MELFLQAGSSDITGVTVSDPSGRVVGALRSEMRALSTVFREQYPRVWEDALKDVGVVSADGDASSQLTKTDKEWRKTLVKCADRLVGWCDTDD